MEEKRNFIRLDIPVKVKYNVPGAPTKSSEAVCKNISAVGIRFVAKGDIKAGLKMDLFLNLPEVEEAIPVTAEVVWAKEDFTQGERAYDVGLKFININEDKRKVFLQYLCDKMFEQLKEL